MSLVGIGIAAVVGDIGGQALADFLTPHIFGAGEVSSSSVEQAAADGMAFLEAARFQSRRYVGWARLRRDAADEQTQDAAFDTEAKRDRWWSAMVAEHGRDALVWARYVDTVTMDYGPVLAGESTIRYAAGPTIPDASSTSFRVFTFAAKALVGGLTFAVGKEIGAFT